MSKLSLEQLIAKKMELNQRQSRDVHVASLKGELTLVKVPIDKILDAVNDAQNGSEAERFEAIKNLIYLCCPMMHSEKLQKAFECDEPTDIVTKLLADDIGDMYNISSEILAMYGLDKIQDKVKN